MEIIYKEIDNTIEARIVNIWGDWVTKYGCLHYGKGCYSLAALADGIPVGFISTYPAKLPKPLDLYCDAFIDDLEVDEKYRRQGIASKLLSITEEWARTTGYHQIRAWSSDEQDEAIPMWYALGYTVCPAIMRGESVIKEFAGKPIHGFYVAKIL